MIQVQYVGRLGNNLFQYCLGRILAERLGYALYADPLPGFPGTFATVEGTENADAPVVELTGHTVDLDSLIADTRPRRIVLNGFFQVARYYLPYRTQIQSWLRQEDCDQDTAADEMLALIRLGEFKDLEFALHEAYFERLLESTSFRRLWITSDELEHPLIADLCRKFGGEAQALSPIETLGLARRCGKLILSNSTFAWWAAFLSEAQEIHFPMPNSAKGGSWGIGRVMDGLDLRIDEPRYHYHYNVPIAADPVAPLDILAASWRHEELQESPLSEAHLSSKAYWWRCESPRPNTDSRSGASRIVVIAAFESPTHGLDAFVRFYSLHADWILITIPNGNDMELKEIEQLRSTGLPVIHRPAMREEHRRDHMLNRLLAEASKLFDADFIVVPGPGKPVLPAEDLPLRETIAALHGNRVTRLTQRNSDSTDSSLECLIIPRPLALRVNCALADGGRVLMLNDIAQSESVATL